MKHTTIDFEWKPKRLARSFRTGISLHSHTLHSKESLDFIWKAARNSALLRWVLRNSEWHYQASHGRPLDLGRGWWTPPLAPAEAHNLEAAQIERLGMRPIVSLTDHDDIEAPMSLQAVNASREVPVSVEWTVPYQETFFHLGVHNLPSAQARSIMADLSAYTAKPTESRLRDLLALLAGFRETLVILNHPLWDEKGIGVARHVVYAQEMVARFGAFIHALEINGLRPRRENRAVTQFADSCGLPAISGGDRHTLEPNATLNFTDAANFSEFADEIRNGRCSHVWVSSAYRQCYEARIFHNMIDVFRTYPDHGLGWSEWTDRIFFEREDGVVMSLRDCWERQPPGAIGLIGSLMQMAGQPKLRSALYALMPRREEVPF